MSEISNSINPEMGADNLADQELRDLAEQMAVWIYQYDKHHQYAPSKQEVLSELVGRSVKIGARVIFLNEPILRNILDYLEKHGSDIDLDALMEQGHFKMF